MPVMQCASKHEIVWFQQPRRSQDGDTAGDAGLTEVARGRDADGRSCLGWRQAMIITSRSSFAWSNKGGSVLCTYVPYLPAKGVGAAAHANTHWEGQDCNKAAATKAPIGTYPRPPGGTDVPAQPPRQRKHLAHVSELPLVR